MAYRKSRRVFRKSRRGMRYLKRKREMARIKKDIMKCNFPTKIKFMGLPERKTMFLQKEISFQAGKSPNHFSITLNPFDTDNLTTLFNGDYPNWDKIKVLAIYVKMTPNRNTWSEASSMTPIKCFYNVSNASDGDTYDENIKKSKQLFVFNCNENFTIYLGKPQTMTASDGVIYKPGQWFSLGEFTDKNVDDDDKDDDDKDGDDDNNKQKKRMMKEDEEEMEEDFFVGTNADVPTSRSTMSCGRLHFTSTKAIDYTVSISYKVALKG